MCFVHVFIAYLLALLDDLDKELNTYAMRVKEWYGWHFPELARILSDNLLYARVVRFMGMILLSFEVLTFPRRSYQH